MLWGIMGKAATKTNVLVVGVGSIGERHLRVFQRSGRCELAICEVNPELRTTIADRYGITASYADVDTALHENKFDAAVIATPAPLHIPIATQLAEQQVHLLIEKPLSISLDGVDELQSVIDRHQLVVAVGYSHRAHPVVQGVKQAVDSERFGRPMTINVSCGQPFYHFRPAYRDVYFAHHEQGGGAIQDGITHLYNVVEWLVGPMDRLITDAAHQQLEGVDVEDTVHTLARHGDVMACYRLNLHQRHVETVVTVVCESGSVRADYENQRWSWMTEVAGEWHHEPVSVPERDIIYLAQANRFLDVLEGSGQPLCSLDEAVQTLRVNIASFHSARDGTWQEISR